MVILNVKIETFRLILETTGITIDNVDNTDTNASIINDSGQLNVANLPPYRALYYIIRIK